MEATSSIAAFWAATNSIVVEDQICSQISGYLSLSVALADWASNCLAQYANFAIVAPTCDRLLTY